MAGIIPDNIVAMARIDDTGNAATFGFANGLETGTPTGATAGAAAIDRIAQGNYIVYLDDSVEYGSATQQGGLSAVAMSAETGVFVPVVAFCTVAHGDTTGENAAYVGVDAQKKLHIRCYTDLGAIAPVTGVTLIVFRNPVTVFP